MSWLLASLKIVWQIDRIDRNSINQGWEYDVFANNLLGPENKIVKFKSGIDNLHISGNISTNYNLQNINSSMMHYITYLQNQVSK